MIKRTCLETFRNSAYSAVLYSLGRKSVVCILFKGSTHKKYNRLFATTEIFQNIEL